MKLWHVDLLPSPTLHKLRQSRLAHCVPEGGTVRKENDKIYDLQIVINILDQLIFISCYEILLKLGIDYRGTASAQAGLPQCTVVQ